jgi:hypothetical protein
MTHLTTTSLDEHLSSLPGKHQTLGMYFRKGTFELGNHLLDWTLGGIVREIGTIWSWRKIQDKGSYIRLGIIGDLLSNWHIWLYGPVKLERIV